MRKLYLAFVFTFALHIAFAQVANGSFENWYSGTSIFSFPPFIASDTFQYYSPVDWSCSNYITMSNGLHHTILVDSSASAQGGNKSLYMHTDSIYIDAAGIYLTIPGFAVNGNFPLNISDVMNGSGSLNPINLKGAGMPCATHLKSLGFYMKYNPIANDSCLIWAVLKKQGQAVADFRFTYKQALNSFTYFEKDFVYHSCETPDTLVIVFSTSNPNFATLGSGSTGLNAGSEIWIDSVQTTDLPQSYNFAPVAVSDATYTFMNTAKTIAVLPNDFDCENDPLTVSITGNPLHGTATLTGANEVVYTPANGYSGKDSLQYTISDGQQSAIASVVINVFTASGLKEILQEAIIYPQPANNTVTITGLPTEQKTVYFLNTQGQIVTQATGEGAVMQLNICELQNGLYLLKIETKGGSAPLLSKVFVQH